MSLIDQDKLKSRPHFNFAPMIDFLFLMLAFFATLAVSRASLYDTKLSLAQLIPEKDAVKITQTEEPFQINLSISNDGSYKWVTEVQSYNMENLEKIKKEIKYQYNIGLLPKDKNQTQILLHIDKSASWEQVAKLIFAIREEGFEAYPIYEPEEA